MTGGGKAAGLVYALSALPASTEPAKPLKKQLAIADPSALLTYDSDRVLAQMDGDELAPLGNAKWADSLTKLVQSRIVQSFENTGSLNEVSRPIEGGTPEYQLATEIRKFQIVNAPERKAEAQISAKVIAADGHIVAARVFDGSAPVKSAEEAEAAKGAERGFREDFVRSHTLDCGCHRWRRRETFGCTGTAEKPRPGARITKPRLFWSSTLEGDASASFQRLYEAVLAACCWRPEAARLFQFVQGREAGGRLAQHLRCREVPGSASPPTFTRIVLPFAVLPRKRRSKNPPFCDSADGPSPGAGRTKCSKAQRVGGIRLAAANAPSPAAIA